MKIFVQNTAHGLVPLYDDDYEEKRKLKIGEVYYCEIKKPRNYMFHCKFFALIKLGHENTRLDLPEDAYRAYVVMKAGFADVFELPNGKKMALPKSISFSNMDEDEFQKVYHAVLSIIKKDIGVDNDVIEKELQNYM